MNMKKMVFQSSNEETNDIFSNYTIFFMIFITWKFIRWLFSIDHKWILI